MNKILTAAVFALGISHAQAQMIAPLNILHGSDYGASSDTNVFGPQHMSFANGVVTIQGDLDASDSYMLDYKIKAEGWRVVSLNLNSGGGSVYAANNLAHMVRQHGWSTVAQTCESACVILWASGRSKVVQGHLGVHQAVDSLQLDLTKGSLKGSARTGAILRSYGAPQSVVAHMMATPPSQIYTLSASEVRSWK
jgi:hypothetical protein